MNANIENQNLYLAELKSLVKDKFFMLLLGISVSIVLLSTIYSVIKPKESGQIASGTQTTNEIAAESGEIANVPTVYLEGIDSIEGLEEQAVESPVATGTQTSFFEKVKKGAQDLFKGNKGQEGEDETLAQTMQKEQEQKTMLEAKIPKVGGTYVVQEGDNLWMIAEKAYNSGYNYVDLVTANNLAYNGDMIDVGQKLTIPQVDPKTPTTGDITSQAVATRSQESVPATYTAVGGDCLWTIAGTQYNDPYMWTRIAQLNSLPNPDFIMVGQVLKLK